ncbi:MAG: hypothetical protein ACLPSH_00385 [Vulcanimicrobiaceae bacterium]
MCARLSDRARRPRRPTYDHGKNPDSNGVHGGTIFPEGIGIPKYLFREYSSKRYLSGAGKNKKVEVWKFNRRVRSMHPGEMLRVIGEGRFVLRWTSDHWASAHDSASQANRLDIDHVDLIELATTSGMLVEFTFFGIDANRWGAELRHRGSLVAAGTR